MAMGTPEDRALGIGLVRVMARFNLDTILSMYNCSVERTLEERERVLSMSGLNKTRNAGNRSRRILLRAELISMLVGSGYIGNPQQTHNLATSERLIMMRGRRSVTRDGGAGD